MAGSIGPIVRRYFETFFDSVDFYHEMVRDEIETTRKDVAELYGMVASNRSDADNPERLQKITDLQKRIDERSNYLEGGKIVSDAIAYATGTLAEMDPELTARFGAEPAAGKYDYLLDKYRLEHKEDVQKRLSAAEESFTHAAVSLVEHDRAAPSLGENVRSFGRAGREWNRRHEALEREVAVREDKWRRMERHASLPFVVDLEVEAEAQNKVKKLFPDIATQYSEEERKRHEQLLRDDPFELGEELLENYTVLYADVLADELTRVANDYDYANSLLFEHNENKPTFFKNITTLGRAQAAWNEKKLELQEDVSYCSRELEKVESRRREQDADGVSGEVNDWVMAQISKNHPEVMAAREKQEQELWERTNRAEIGIRDVGCDDRGEDDSLALGKAVTR